MATSKGWSRLAISSKHWSATFRARPKRIVTRTIEESIIDGMVGLDELKQLLGASRLLGEDGDFHTLGGYFDGAPQSAVPMEADHGGTGASRSSRWTAVAPTGYWCRRCGQGSPVIFFRRKNRREGDRTCNLSRELLAACGLAGAAPRRASGAGIGADPKDRARQRTGHSRPDLGAAPYVGRMRLCRALRQAGRYGSRTGDSPAAGNRMAVDRRQQGTNPEAAPRGHGSGRRAFRAPPPSNSTSSAV